MSTEVERLAFELGGDIGDMMVVAALGQALLTGYQDPRRMPMPEKMRHAVESLQALERRTSDRCHKMAIVVENDPSDRRRAAVLFKELGFEAVETDSAEVAVGHLERQGGDVAVLFTDVALAGLMNGVELARAVSVLWPRTRVLVTSEASDRSPRLPMAVQYLPKPWRGLDVITAAQEALARPAPAVT
jgi:CheY-like chemotaxis protein